MSVFRDDSRSQSGSKPNRTRLQLEPLEARENPATFNIAAGDEAAFIAAVVSANGTPANDVINLTNSTYDFTTVAEFRFGPNALPTIPAGSGTLTIRGNGATLTRNVEGTELRFFCVDGGRLFIDSMTLENGSQSLNDGGAVFLAEGTFDARRTLFVGNRARNGGAIAAISTIDNGNRALTGNLSLFLFNSTLSENEALGQSTLSGGNGGAVYFDLDADSGATIRNTTIARNSVDDFDAPGTGAGLYRTDASGDINIENSLFSSNFSRSESQMDLGAGTVATFDARNSLFEDLNGITVLGPGNIVTPDARIGFLENNGGPTRTHRPFSDSPAINNGDNAFRPPVPAGSAADTLDQRGVGFARVVGTRIDIGAVEYKANTTVTLRSSKNPSRPNELVTFTATVRSTFQGTPSGAIAFYIRGVFIGRVTLNANATASIPVSNLTAGRHTVVAVYEPEEESGFDGATASLIQTVTVPGRRWVR